MRRMIFTTVLMVASVLAVTANAAAADLPSALVDPYLKVQTALSNDKLDDLAALSKAIEEASTPLGKDAEAIAAGARKLAAAKDLAGARTAFGEMSTALFAYAEKTKSGFGAGVRHAYCPMADKSWLQKESEIKNPYYGSAMLTCGSFKN
jgi:hypothetical protein